MRPTTTIIALALCIIAPAAAMGQYVEVWRFTSRDALSLNVDRLFDYNLYEHVRLGAGLRYSHSGPLRRDGRRTLLEADGYLAYGVRDERWKGGLTLSHTTATRTHARPYAFARYDLEAAASRQVEAHSLTGIATAAHLMASRFAEAATLGAGVEWQARPRLTLGIEARWSHETPLYDAQRTYYLKQGIRHRDLGRGRYAEATLNLRHLGGLRAMLTAGLAADVEQPYLRLLAQYRRSKRLGPLSLTLFAQGGWATGGTPYSRLFALAGSQGTPLNLAQTLCSARPNQFGGNLFALGTARLEARKPLFEYIGRISQMGTRPRPFVQVAAAWSHLQGQGADGLARVPRGEALPDGTRLEAMAWQSLAYGIAEVQAGAEGLVHWGVADYGLALAWRWVPPSAPYRNARASDDLTLLFTVGMAL